MSKNQKGFVHLIAIIILALVVTAGIGYYAYHKIILDSSYSTGKNENALESDSINIDATLIRPESASPADRKAGNAARKSGLYSLSEALSIYISENDNTIPLEITDKFRHISKTEVDLCNILTPKYLGSIPRDPRLIYDINNKYNSGGFVYDCKSDYQTGYAIKKTTDNKVVIMAPLAEGGEEVSISK